VGFFCVLEVVVSYTVFFLHCCYGVVILLLLGSCYFWDVDMSLKFWAATAHDEIKTGCEVGGEEKES
jgi:hypothetical protein